MEATLKIVVIHQAIEHLPAVIPGEEKKRKEDKLRPVFDEWLTKEVDDNYLVIGSQSNKN